MVNGWICTLLEMVHKFIGFALSLPETIVNPPHSELSCFTMPFLLLGAINLLPVGSSQQAKTLLYAVLKRYAKT